MDVRVVNPSPRRRGIRRRGIKIRSSFLILSYVGQEF